MPDFHPAIARWFGARFEAPTRAQALAWPPIAAGENVLLVAPTGSGKTLAAFLALIDRLVRQPTDGAGVRVLYVSPLKALNNDIQRNLEDPLAGIARAAAELGLTMPAVRTAVRTGDTLANERHRMTRTPPDVLITTPESLYLILTSPRARDMLRSVEHVIVDEIHAVAGTKRGSHLVLSLERLARLRGRDFQRLGLSATINPLDEVARFLGGVGRAVQIVDAGQHKALDLQVECPVEDFAAPKGDSPWDEIEPRILELIQAHRTTLVFVNNRRSAERLTHHLNELNGAAIAKAHHGSMSREERLAIESSLKKGELRCLVATGSLELGIDIGSVDLAVLVESPRGIARGLQRVGRSGHLVGQTSKGRLIPKFRGDLVECAAVARGMREAAVEPLRVPRNPLDVVAQQVVAMATVDEWPEDALYDLVRRAYPFRDLPRSHFEGVLAMLSGKYPAAEFGELRPRVVWDRASRTIRGRAGAKTLALISGGTIPDRGSYQVVHAARGVRLGDLDEEMVFETRVGDVFVLGTQTWRVAEITPNQVVVSEAQGALPTIPFWKGDALGRTYELGTRVARMFTQVGQRLDEPGTVEWLKAEHALDDAAAANLLDYIKEQAEASALPGERRIVVEAYHDEIGDRRIVIHSPFGRQVNRPWLFALQEALCRDGQCSDTSVTDDGMLLRLPATERIPPLDLLRRVTRSNLDELLLGPLSRSSLFAARFRENAQRALLLPRAGPDRRTPLWLQRLRAADLLEVARKYDDFPMVHETVRELLEDWFDLPRLRELVGGIETGAIEVVVRETESASPFAAALAFQFIGDFMEEGDRQQPEFREVALSLDRGLLRELLGTTSLRELLEPAAIAEVEARLQRTAPTFRAKDRDEVEDLLIRLGDLSEAEVVARAEGDAAAWLSQLEAEGRARQLESARWIASVDAETYAKLDRKPLVRRYLATHGPARQVALEARFDFDVGDVLADLERAGTIVGGEFTRGETGLEYVDAHVLEQVHRATLARLRREIEPRDAASYARFLLRWHWLVPRDREVADVLEQLQGVWLPVEVWERDVLPARVAGYQTSQLDAACASGEFTWLARKGGEQAKPRVAFFRRAELARLAAPEEVALSEEAQAVLAELRTRGASFLDKLVVMGRPVDEVLRALWELVWAGLVTNDAFDPLRHAPRSSEGDEFARLTDRDARRALSQRTKRTARAAAGRWSAVWDVAPAVAEAERAEAWARVLIDRHGVVAYEHFEKEEAGLPWAVVAEVLRRLEMRGEVRRGYFVAGFSGMQFAHRAAVERLRDEGEDRSMRLVAAMDPANPYGSALPSPAEGFARIPGAYLVLEGGTPALRVEGGGRRLVPLNGLLGTRLTSAVGTLSALLRAPAPYRGRRLEVAEFGEAPAAQSAAAEALARAGFEESGEAMILWPSRAR